MRVAALCTVLFALNAPSAFGAMIEVSPGSVAVQVGGTVTLGVRPTITAEALQESPA